MSSPDITLLQAACNHPDNYLLGVDVSQRVMVQALQQQLRLHISQLERELEFETAAKRALQVNSCVLQRVLCAATCVVCCNVCCVLQCVLCGVACAVFCVLHALNCEL